MQFGNRTIILPADDPCDFDPSWRADLAGLLADNKGAKFPSLYKACVNDKYVQKYATYLRAVKAGKNLTDAQLDMHRARGWYENESPSGVRFRLEPLLLTGATMDTIMLDISGGMMTVEPFKMYEKLFFNIRDDEWRLSKSCQLRQAFAMPNGDDMHDASPQEIWKAIAALMGYDVLMHVWMWDGHGMSTKGADFLLDETWRAAQSRLFMSVFSDRVGNNNLGDILAAYTSQFKMLRDVREVDAGGSDTTKALMSVLYKAAPKMVGISRDVDAMSGETLAIQARISSQLAIEKKAIEDRGKSVSDSVVDAQIVEAVNR